MSTANTPITLGSPLVAVVIVDIIETIRTEVATGVPDPEAAWEHVSEEVLHHVRHTLDIHDDATEEAVGQAVKTASRKDIEGLRNLGHDPYLIGIWAGLTIRELQGRLVELLDTPPAPLPAHLMLHRSSAIAPILPDWLRKKEQ